MSKTTKKKKSTEVNILIHLSDPNARTGKATLSIKRGDLGHILQIEYSGLLLKSQLAEGIQNALIALTKIEATPPQFKLPSTPKNTTTDPDTPNPEESEEAPDPETTPDDPDADTIEVTPDEESNTLDPEDDPDPENTPNNPDADSLNVTPNEESDTPDPEESEGLPDPETTSDDPDTDTPEATPDDKLDTPDPESIKDDSGTDTANDAHKIRAKAKDSYTATQCKICQAPYYQSRIIAGRPQIFITHLNGVIGITYCPGCGCPLSTPDTLHTIKTALTLRETAHTGTTTFIIESEASPPDETAEQAQPSQRWQFVAEHYGPEDAVVQARKLAKENADIKYRVIGFPTPQKYYIIFQNKFTTERGTLGPATEDHLYKASITRSTLPPSPYGEIKPPPAKPTTNSKSSKTPPKEIEKKGANKNEESSTAQMTLF